MSHSVPQTRHFAVSLGGRLEGVPVRDIFGSSEGFRRPGYVLSIDPGVFYVWGRHTISVNVPVPLERNRRRSTSDIIDGRNGDAAFADYLLIVSYSRSF